MNVAVVGSRNWTDRELLNRVLRDLREHIVEQRDPSEEEPEGNRGLDDLIIVSGGARGVDSMAADFAVVNWLGLVEHMPDWNRFGRSAAFKRNVLIVEDADLVLAFQRNRSSGTQHSIDLAHARNIPVIVWTEGN